MRACGAEEGLACRTPAGYPADEHKARRQAVGKPSYEQWRARGLLDDLAPRAPPIPAHNAHAASEHLNVGQPLGDAVELVCRALADRYGQLLLNKDTLDALDPLGHHLRVLLLALGSEGRAEIVTVLLLEHAL
ncbi:hypothetical protein [Streptomyces griseoflavus]|uniref:hypothetical protein n=1 Tax=Streptomyces griseoflavus TaxID=35619 RepID=UPI003D730D5E